MLLDEFTALGRIPIIAEAISYLPGYNVRVVLVIQTPAQLREVYGIHNAEDDAEEPGGAHRVRAEGLRRCARDLRRARIYDRRGEDGLEAHRGTRFDQRGQRSRSQNVSEQRRALLLPQEVKELGTEEAIVFYEGLRPIRCRKIRYFAEKSFRRRLLPPPASPTPPHRVRLPQSPAACAAPSVQATSAPPKDEPQSSETSAPIPPAEDPIVTREARPEDVERIDSLTLEDFATDFSKLQMPQREGPLSDVEMSAAVESFVSALRAR